MRCSCVLFDLSRKTAAQELSPGALVSAPDSPLGGGQDQRQGGRRGGVSPAAAERGVTTASAGTHVRRPDSPPTCQTFFSFEFFPPKSDEGLENLWERMDTMVALQARRLSPPKSAWTRTLPSRDAHPAPPCRRTHARQSAAACWFGTQSTLHMSTRR